MRYKYPLVFGAVLVTTLLSPLAWAQHEGDIVVGRSATGQLKIEAFDPFSSVVVLPPVNGILKGWADNDPGLDHLVIDEPGTDLFTLESGADVWLELVSAAPAFRAISPSLVILDAAGESFLLGDSELHIHPTWHINNQDAAFDPLRTHWPVTFRLVDLGTTGYAASEPFLIIFANQACVTGDVSGDATVDSFDIGPFVTTLTDPASATAAQRCAADANLDGEVDAFDIGAFVEVLTGG